MANLENILNQNPITTVTATQPDNLLGGIADIGNAAAQASENSKLLMYGAQAHSAFKALDAQYRTTYADDPNSADGQAWLQEQRQQITDGLGQNISSFSMRQWQDKTAELATQSDISNDAWGVHQNYRNAVNNTNDAMKTYIDSGNQDGKAYGLSGSTDGANIMGFLNARQTIQDSVAPTIGTAKTGALMKNFDADYTKSFVAGTAETSPEKATELLNMPEIQQHFSTQDRDDMVQVISKVQKAQELQKQMSVTNQNGTVPDIVNDPSMSYFEKRAKIDQMDLDGTISPQIAAKSRRVLTSSADLETQTDTPAMSGVVNQIYDLNANATSNGDDYLRGVQNIQGQILDMQGDGRLTARDALKLNNQVRTLTSAKLASATQEAGSEFYDANQKFTTLPPEYRGDATRQLFYAGDGKNWNDSQYGAAALQIIDKVNSQRRQDAQKVVAATSAPDAQMAKDYNITPEAITQTAKKYGISEQEVVRQLRRKHLESQQPQRGGAQSGAVDTSSKPDAAPSIVSPATTVKDETDPTDDEGSDQ